MEGGGRGEGRVQGKEKGWMEERVGGVGEGGGVGWGGEEMGRKGGVEGRAGERGGLREELRGGGGELGGKVKGVRGVWMGGGSGGGEAGVEWVGGRGDRRRYRGKEGIVGRAGGVQSGRVIEVPHNQICFVVQ